MIFLPIGSLSENQPHRFMFVLFLGEAHYFSPFFLEAKNACFLGTSSFGLLLTL
jgi:hypothetical protein